MPPASRSEDDPDLTTWNTNSTVGEIGSRNHRDLADGTWDASHGHLRTQPTFEGSLILVTSQP